jgi:hypothetical protein
MAKGTGGHRLHRPGFSNVEVLCRKMSEPGCDTCGNKTPHDNPMRRLQMTGMNPTLIRLRPESFVDLGAVAPKQQWAIRGAFQVCEADRPWR